MKKLNNQFKYKHEDGFCSIWGKKNGVTTKFGECHPQSISFLKEDWKKYNYLIKLA